MTGCCWQPAPCRRSADPGIRSPGVFTCWTLADARRIAGAVQRSARVLQLGAGFIGCIIMESIAAREASLTVVEIGDCVLPRMMPPDAAALIKRWYETKGSCWNRQRDS